MLADGDALTPADFIGLLVIAIILARVVRVFIGG